MHNSVDEDMIGGLTVRVGDYQIDGSVRRHLTEMKKRILEAPIQVICGKIKGVMLKIRADEMTAVIKEQLANYGAMSLLMKLVLSSKWVMVLLVFLALLTVWLVKCLSSTTAATAWP